MNLKQKLKNLVYGDKITPLPTGTALVLFITLLLGSMIVTMVFSFLPELVKSFGVSDVGTGYYAGLIGSALFAGRAFSSLFWGYLADVKGKKFATILSATALSITTLAFGFSTRFTWALVTRFLQGIFMGVNVITKAMMADVCDDTNHVNCFPAKLPLTRSMRKVTAYILFRHNFLSKC
ncbi:uncharacterized protein LOC130629177 [Hydractinia symbiolongicarpus]|uniref:uncharacterized protein LOC130629177 n=1 Tax=Hydractinia symbiolongicarpus TaxID=13093 RepID=UPI00254CA59B|nr:uncharacterized protein LOC130629177 [Hydractinia symbiolongicarpus]